MPSRSEYTANRDLAEQVEMRRFMRHHWHNADALTVHEAKMRAEAMRRCRMCMIRRNSLALRVTRALLNILFG